MSRRFGRNQRRRAREALAQAVAENESQRRLADTQAEELRILNDAMDTARKVLGHHIALPPTLWGDHPHALGEDFRVGPKPNLSYRGLATAAERPPAMFKAIEMRTLLGHVRKHHDRFSRDLHFYATLDSGAVAYCIAADTIYSTDRASLVERLAKEIGDLCAEELVKNLRKGARRA